MKLKTGLRVRGTVELRDTDTGELLARSRNMVVTAGRNLMGNLLVNAPGYAVGLTYCAGGTGTTAVSAGQTQLVTESFRDAITSSPPAVANVITLSTFFTAAVCGIFLKEFGLFGHSTASAVADSGVMFSRALLSYDNSGTPRNLTVTWTITITG
jgi:hypothetical protein